MDFFIVVITETTGWDAGEYEITDTYLITDKGDVPVAKVNERVDVFPARLEQDGEVKDIDNLSDDAPEYIRI